MNWRDGSKVSRAEGAMGPKARIFQHFHFSTMDFMYTVLDWTMVAAGQWHDFGSGVSILGRQN